MFTHNLNPILFDLGFFSVKWYSLAYIVGIVFGWSYGKNIIFKKFQNQSPEILKNFDDLITYLIIAIVIGGRLGYVIFYNFDYYFFNPIEIFKIWQGGMSFHGALIGIIFVTYYFSKKKKFKSTFFFRYYSMCCSSWNFTRSYSKFH